MSSRMSRNCSYKPRRGHFSLYGAGKPRAAHDRVVVAIFAILAFLKATESVSELWLPHPGTVKRQTSVSTSSVG